MERNFMELIRYKWNEGKFLCVGLDIEYLKLSFGFLNKHQDKTKTHAIKIFIEQIIDQTKDVVCAYKPNSAFYEAFGEPGWEILHHAISYIKRVAPDVPIILDAKRADIGSTNTGYVTSVFGSEHFNADAITVHPYMGSKAMQPFLDQKNKGIIVLCKTSNDGSDEFQNLSVLSNGQKKPLYEVVAETVSNTWNYNGNCLLVVGATYPKELAQIRAIVPHMPLLIPGIGKQGGDLQKVLQVGLDTNGQGVIINSSSAIMYDKNPGEAAHRVHRDIVETIRLVQESERL